MKGLDLQAVDYINKDTPISVVVSKINNILNTLRVQHERSIQELRTAAEALNLISIPQDAPNVPGFSINFWHQSYQNYPGGDFIDFIKIDDRFTFIVLGDVMGKKWGAWFFSFNFLSYIRSAVRLCVYDGEFTTSTILQKINQIICLDSVLSDVLSTLSLVMINHKENKVAYAGAGDLPLIYYNKKSNKITPLRSTGLILGLFQEGLYTEEVLEIGSGDQLLIISDGMTDFQDNNGKMSDFSLFLKNIHNYMGHEDTFTLLKQNVCFTDPTKEQVDDCSLIFIQKV
jgi:sigma-B regulation protein RsbU (phosphoserine phosphatase)